MKETIYSIPINESFEILDGECPVCRLHSKLIGDTLDYILGAAMMESDVRKRTNALGFCQEHLALLIERQKRLPLALMLQTHLETLIKDEKRLLTQGCYVCERVAGFLRSYYANILYLWRTEEVFRKKWDAQTAFCRPHIVGLSELASKELSKKEAAAFKASLLEKSATHMNEILESLNNFIKSFDHRYSKTDLGKDKMAVQLCEKYLGGAYKS